MPQYRRAWMPGGSYFFTLKLYQRRSDLLVRHIECLRTAVQRVRQTYPFVIHGWVVLPDHMHALITLPPDDCRYPLRWRLIKSTFSKSLRTGELRSDSRIRRGERGIWQRRFWEHLIRDEADFHRHMDYIHFNPVKHGHVDRVADWPYSTFHRLVQSGYYPADWGA
ncbi:REP-associated tyrosine transposase [Neptuniibacter halophilus]|uniref:REP-associated tyrosine transposase n=1 Tax=Neptuniibacter halophilus TaxID=651666 RepID=UPI00257283D8|nr:transposase [Neptuniibacter halophilus]